MAQTSSEGLLLLSVPTERGASCQPCLLPSVCFGLCWDNQVWTLGGELQEGAWVEAEWVAGGHWRLTRAVRRVLTCPLQQGMFSAPVTALLVPTLRGCGAAALWEGSRRRNRGGVGSAVETLPLLGYKMTQSRSCLIALLVRAELGRAGTVAEPGLCPAANLSSHGSQAGLAGTGLYLDTFL